jgi:hypothetical protein
MKAAGEEHPRYLWFAWIAYVAGFGMVESNVAAPAVLTLYALLFARKYLPAALLFWIPALLFAAGHFLLIPKTAASAYQMSSGAGIAQAAATYWTWSWFLEPSAPAAGLSMTAGYVCTAIFTLLAAVLLIHGPTRKLALFGAGCWLMLLGPTLPLTSHISDYYLTAPLIGCAVLISASRRLHKRALVPALALALAVEIPISRTYARAQVSRSRDIEALVRGVEQIARLHPRKTILLSGVGDDLFWSGVYDRPFSLVTNARVILTPETAATLTPYQALFHPEDYTVPAPVVRELLKQDAAVVYAVSNRRLIAATDVYKAAAARNSDTEVPGKILTGDPAYSPFLSHGWHNLEEGFRWMEGTATVQVGGSGGAIWVRGFCRPEQIEETGRLTVQVDWNGTDLGFQVLRNCPAEFELAFPLRGVSPGAGTVRLRARPTLHLGTDPRELGLAVTSVERR